MDYIIVSTSRCQYQAWQLKLMEWSIRRVRQKGTLLLLMSEDLSHKNESPDMQFGRGVEVIDLPDWAQKWKKDHDDWWGGIPNKYESFNWLADKYPFKDDDVLLFLDPDMLFIDQVPAEYLPKENEIIGQLWRGYSSIKGWDKYDKAFMYPFILRASTLDKIKEDFKTYCYKIRKQEKRWESDMWALDYAAKDNQVQIKYINDLGKCTVWQPNGDRSLSPIIHYPNVVKDASKEKIFFKQDYTFHPDQRIEIHRARNKIDKALLINIAQQRTDFLYFIKWDFEQIFKFYTGEKGYLVLKPWPGGFNNIRMSLELGVCLAYLTNRILVLPPTYKMYLLEGKSDFSSFFDTNNLGIKHLRFEEFCQLKGIEESEEEIKKISKVLDYDAVGHVVNFEEIEVPDCFTKKRNTLISGDLFDDSEVIYLYKNLLGNFYQSIYTSYERELKQLIAKHVVYRKEIFDLSWEFINYIGDQSYYAIHVRRNDFQYKNLFITCEELLANIIELLPPRCTLYIATDHKDRSFFRPLEEHYKLVFYSDVRDELQLEEFDPNWIPIVEQFICTRSIRFIGMKLSTLSSYVFRMRGYMDDIEDKQYYINTEKYLPRKQCTFRGDQHFIANWAREYKDSWDFRPATIFISIASYCDQQLIPTIQNLLEEAADPSRLTIGVHLQDSTENHEILKSHQFPNIRILFTPKEASKGVVWARNLIKEQLFSGEDFYLQIDAHSRFKQNWDNILLNQYKSIQEPKVIITTYPNHFEISDEKKEYLKTRQNSPLIIKKFLSDYELENRLRPRNLRSLEPFAVAENLWCSAGFLFTASSWIEDVIIPDEIRFNGEEDLLTFISFRKGYNLRVPSEATVWHNYNYKNEKTGERYKDFNENKIYDDSMNIVNRFLFDTNYERPLEDLENYLNIKFKRIPIPNLIFISIASYLDPELRLTIIDCVAKAKNPQNLIFGICIQYDDNKKTNAHCIDDLASQYNILFDKYPHQESRGPCWARQKTQLLHRNEKYYMQVDAHTRFIKNWDDILIKNHTELQSHSEKPIISYRPPSYQGDEKHEHDLNFRFRGQLDKINIPRILGINSQNLLDYQDFNEISTGYKSHLVPVLDGSFIFCRSEWIKEVEQDPDFYYVGEEVALSLRSFTNGFDIFTPKQIVSWHRDRTDEENKHYHKHNLQEVQLMHRQSLQKLDRLLNHAEFDKYGLGRKRSLDDFEKLFRINFKEKKVMTLDFTQISIEMESVKAG